MNNKRIFTNSEFSSYQQCPYMWMLKYKEMLEPNRKSDKLTFGSLLHSALEIFYKENPAAAITWATNEINKELALPANDVERVSILEEQKELITSMLNMYIDFTKNDKHKMIEMEFQGRVPIEAPSGRASSVYDYVFKLDGLLEIDNQLWIKEYKSASTIDSRYLENLQLDEQINRYIYGVEKMLGRKVAGVIYDIFRKKVPSIPKMLANGSLSKDMKIDTTYQVYKDTIDMLGYDSEDYKEILEMLEKKGNTFIYRVPIYRNDREKKETKERMYNLAKTMNVDTPIWKCPSRDCGWKCDYRSLCLDPDSSMKETNYRIREKYHPELNNEEKEINNGNDCKE